MKRFVAVAVMLIVSGSVAYAYDRYGYSSGRSTNVGGYYRSDGGYVDSYRRTLPNRTDMDNYGTKGNYNPYTGNYGTRAPRGW